jgi:trimeric autotransporter adhesin
VDAAGNVYVADSGNNAVRVLRPVSASMSLGAVVNSASNRAGAIAPGEVVTLYGGGLTGVQSVLFNGFPGPVLYSRDTQVGALVPYALTSSAVQIVAQRADATSTPLPATLAATAPGIFTADGSGTGPAVATNQDGSANTPANPAAVGSLISLYATGEGQTTPAGVDGKLGAAPLPKPLAQVTATIGGVPAEVKYAGGASGIIAGVMQVNLTVPAGLSGTVPVVIAVGGVSSQSGVTVSVR